MCSHSLCALFALCHIQVMSACFKSIYVIKLLISSGQWGKDTKDNWGKMFWGMCIFLLYFFLESNSLLSSHVRSPTDPGCSYSNLSHLLTFTKNGSELSYFYKLFHYCLSLMAFSLQCIMCRNSNGDLHHLHLRTLIRRVTGRFISSAYLHFLLRSFLWAVPSY